ncbi:MAG: hypothetical protein AAB336_08655 [Acidobacteriota bacterium]|mgnify:CR=1 FL=1
MTNIIRNTFGKLLAIAFLFAIFSVASYAQTNRLYYQQGGAFYGTVTVILGHILKFTPTTRLSKLSAIRADLSAETAFFAPSDNSKMVNTFIPVKATSSKMASFI